MDFDDLKRAWDDCDHELDNRVHLDVRRLRSLLTQNRDANAKKPLLDDIDYTMPVALVQRPLDTNWIVRIARNAAAWIQETCRVDEVAGGLQRSLLRLLRRHRALRG